MLLWLYWGDSIEGEQEWSWRDKQSRREQGRASKRAREICVLSCLYPQLLLYLKHTKMWRYNPLLQQKETLYSSFLYRRVALGVWASVALGTCRLQHKSEGVYVLCGIAPSPDAPDLSSGLWCGWRISNQVAATTTVLPRNGSWIVVTWRHETPSSSGTVTVFRSGESVV